MKRTGEIILSIVGAVIYAGLAVVGIIVRFASGNEELKNNMANEMVKSNPDMSNSEIDAAFDAASGVGLYIIILALVAIILGGVAIYLLKGNKKPKAAGIILIVTGVVSTVITAFMALLCGIFYLVAGIMVLVRKPPHTDEVTEV